MKPILCLGIAPALQRTLEFETCEKGRVNRALARHLSPAGKSVNTGVALQRLGLPAVITGFNGGANGRLVASQIKALGATPAFTRVAGGTRLCTTVLERATGLVTELVEEAPPVTDAERAAFVRRNRALLRESAALAISGTLPAWAPDDFYRVFLEDAAARHVPRVIDSHGRGLLAILDTCPELVKLNRDELAATFPGASPGDAARRVLALGARALFVTDGPRAASLHADGGVWTFTLPKISPVNPIGSGDCATAGLLSRWVGPRKQKLPAAVRFGLACGTANALTKLPADFDPAAARRVEGQITAVNDRGC
ncbi:MAG: PfkB family carbohydrate kinase [Kiritimatiellaeota bacterium]|nr:PfkB family carbohydrate kinase [Kiritimatiellota bacterium]